MRARVGLKVRVRMVIRVRVMVVGRWSVCDVYACSVYYVVCVGDDDGVLCGGGLWLGLVSVCDDVYVVCTSSCVFLVATVCCVVVGGLGLGLVSVCVIPCIIHQRSANVFFKFQRICHPFEHFASFG